MNKLIDKDFYKKLFSLVTPIVIQNFMLALVSATDAIMLGYLTQDAMTAVNFAGQVQFILSMFVTGIAAGLGVMAAQYWGKRDKATIEKVVPIALRLNVVIGVAFTAVALFAPWIPMNILTDSANIRNIGCEYLTWVAFSYLLCAISQVYMAILKNTGHTRTCSVISCTAVVLNIALNYIFIFGFLFIPAMGVKGAALATVSARLYELFFSVVATLGKDYVHVRWGKFFASAGHELNMDFWKYSSPVLWAALVWGFAYSSYSVVMGHMGEDASAAYSVTGIIRSLVACGAHGLSAGTGIMIGNLLGADEFEKAKAYANRLVLLSFYVGLVICGIMCLMAFTVPQLMTNLSEAAKGYLRYTLIVSGVNVCIMSLNTVLLDGIACAGGDSAFDMKGNLIFMWCFGVPLSFLAAFVFKWSVEAVFICISLDEVVKFPFMLRHHFKYVWLRNITRD